MAKSNEGQPEPTRFPTGKAQKNDGLSSSQSVPKASEIFKGPKQPYSDLADPNKKAGKFPG